ncbi:MAG: class I SAM-dependent methyltransferase [Gammaproteobacteria bacterium]
MNADYDVLWSEAWPLLQSIGPLTRSRYRLIERELGPLLRPDSTVLDVGCGNGTLLRRLSLKHAGARLNGIEPSSQALAQADPAIRGFIRNGDLDAELPRFHDDPVDLLVSSEVIEHLADPAHALGMMLPALKRGGTAVFTVPARKHLWSSQDEFAGHVQRFELPEFRRLLKDAGFEVARAYCWGIGPALLYDRLTAWLGPQRTIGAGRSRGGARLASLLYYGFLIEDLFRTRFGFQLVAVARRV